MSLGTSDPAALLGAELGPLAAIQVQDLIAGPYQGWVVWLRDGTMIRESVVHAPRLAPLVAGAIDLPERRPEAGVMAWADVPQRLVAAFALFFARERADGRHTQQPAVFTMHPIHQAHVHLICMPMGGVTMPVGVGEPGRLGRYGYRVGWWDPKTWHLELVEVNRARGAQPLEPCVGHPCWPKAAGGMGLAPAVLGLSADAVPVPPTHP